ncbi:MAG: aldehyde dehydrogenase family protein [Labilithrix sp.]|nr:aldehyde dehydrogenase family protein [Labilithrix sp.]MCW5816549.1 aldehyde dehydrogenase family protein [Labilithrix sp.]
MTTNTLKSWEPATGDLLGEVAITPHEEVKKTIARAKKAQAAWAVLPVQERATRLLRFRDALVERASEVVDVISRECGKPRPEALAHEVMLAVDQLTYYCNNAAKILAPRELPLHLLKHKKSTLHYVPRGVVGIISPWNFPFVIPMADVFAALVTGSAAVVKPSEVTPLSVQKAKEIFDATGLPEDLFGVVHGKGDVGQALIEGGIQKLVFTGGVETGKRVAAACGANLVPCVIELGGKAPLLACSDCDVERTARAIVFGGFVNAGQVCISVERVYAHEAVHDQLVERVKTLTEELRQGDPTADDAIDVGAIIFGKQIEVAMLHIADAVKKGARVVTGGKRRPGPGMFFEPTVLAGCDHSMTVMTQEIFGPIVPIQRVASEDEAVRLANDSHLGLNAYVFTKDREKGRRLAQRIEAGSVVVNDVVSNYAAVEAPFGGVKQSGFGRVHGDDALRDMAETRHVFAGRFPDPQRDPLWFPYSTKVYRWQMRLLRAMYSRGGVVRRLRELF